VREPGRWPETAEGRHEGDGTGPGRPGTSDREAGGGRAGGRGGTESGDGPLDRRRVDGRGVHGGG
jgi:hypothetical protein